MRRVRPILQALTVAVLIVGPAAAAPSAHAQAAIGTRPLRIMPLGDSITHGVGSSTASSYRADLWNRLVDQAGYHIDFVGSQQSGALPDTDNEGHSGWRIDQIAASIDAWMATYQPDVVLLHIGTNDMNQNYHVGTAPARLGALLDQILADRPSTTILVAKIVPSTDATIQSRIVAYNAALPAIVSARGSRVQLVDMSVLSAANMSDTLHPNDSGYAWMAVRWCSALETVLDDGRDWPLFRNGFEPSEPAATWRDTTAAAMITGTVQQSGHRSAAKHRLSNSSHPCAARTAAGAVLGPAGLGPPGLGPLGFGPLGLRNVDPAGPVALAWSTDGIPPGRPGRRTGPP